MQPTDNQGLVVAISSRALFDLEEENDLYEREGTAAFERHQIEHEEDFLRPGPGFPLARALLQLNSEAHPVEVVVVSRSTPAVALRIMRTADHYNLPVRRAAFTSGTPVVRYLDGFGTMLFLSRHRADVREALDHHIAAGLLYNFPGDPLEALPGIRIAFDADAVVFSAGTEQVFHEQGLAAFLRHEKENAQQPLPAGPFAKLLMALSKLRESPAAVECPIRLALITARSSPAHERVIRTLRHWQIAMDEMFFLGGVPKDQILKAFQPHIFFDDQAANCVPASLVAPTAQVPQQ